MNVITIDLEMNQPSGEICQLGYCIHNVKTGKLLQNKAVLVKTSEPLSPFILELTQIKQRDMDDFAINLLDAYAMMVNDINKYQTSKFPLQWGLDHFELIKQLNIKWEDYYFSRRSIDVKSLYQAYAMVRPQGKTVAGLGKACSVLGLEFIGQQHNAMFDALNTFNVFYKLSTKMTKYDEITKVTQK